MADIGKAYVQIEPTAKGISGKITKELGGAGESGGKAFSSGFGKVIGTTGAVVAGAVAAGTVAVGKFATSSIQAGSTFDSAMSQVAATMGTTVDQIGNLRDFAQQMGSSTAFSATEAADALNYMALAGYDADTSMKMLPNVLNLAAAGGIDLASASDMVTDAQTALGLSIEETTTMVDQMAKASSMSNTSVAQLGDAFLTIGANARNVAGGTQELSSVLGVLADNGIKGSEAGTHLRNIMLALNPTTDKAVAAWEKLGVQAYDAEGNLRALPDVFQDLNAAMDGMTDEQKTQMFSDMFNKTDLAAIQALVGTTGDRFNELAAGIGNASGAAQNMADTQLYNLNGDITLFKSALEGAQIAVADQLTPSLREFVQFGSEGLAKLTTAFQEGGVSGAMSAFGEILSDGISMIIEKLPEMVDAGMQLIEALGQGLLDNFPAILSAVGKVILNIATAISDSLPTLIPAIIQALIDIGLYLIEHIDILIDAIIQLMTGLTQGIINAIPILVEKLPEIMLKIGEAIITNAPILVQSIFELMVQLGMAIIEYGPELIMALLEVLVNLGQQIVEYGSQFVQAATAVLTNVVNTVKTWLSQLPTLAANFAGQMVGKFLTFISQLPSKLALIWNNVINNVKAFGQRLVQQGPQMANDFKSKLISTLQTIPSKMLEIGKNIVDGLLNGIKNAWSNLTGAVGEMARSFVEGVKSEFKIGSPSKVMAEEVGQWIPAGIAEGIEAGMGVLNSAVDDMSAEIVTKPNLDVTTSGFNAYNADYQSQNDVASILMTYLPGILTAAQNGKVVLSPDAQGIFRIVRDQNRIMIDTTGYHALA